MKSSKLSPEQREERRAAVLTKRDITRHRHQQRGHTYVQYRTTRFDKHSSIRQRARYARQLAAGQLVIGIVEPSASVKPKRAPRARKTG